MESSLGSIGLGVVGFLGAGLFWWATKHILDRTILPTILDRFVSRSKRRAKDRADDLIKQSVYFLETVAYPRLALTAIAAHGAARADIGFSMVAYLIFSQSALSLAADLSHFSKMISHALIGALALAALISFLATARATRRHYERRRIDLADLEAYRHRTIERVVELLRSAKFSDDEIFVLMDGYAKRIGEVFDKIEVSQAGGAPTDHSLEPVVRTIR